VKFEARKYLTGEGAYFTVVEAGRNWKVEGERSGE